MKDLTQGSVHRLLLEMAAPIAIGMLVQTLYFLVDLYFVARLGDAAIAGVGASGNVTMIIMALTQSLGVGTVALIAQAVGRKDAADANLIFNQSLVLSVICLLLTLALGYVAGPAYMRATGADAATVEAGLAYLRWYTPGLALQFALVAMGSALRGTGIVKPAITVQILTVLLNIVLAPVLIAGWGTGHALGVAGAGLASSLAVGAGVLLMGIYYARLESYVGFHPQLWQPRLATWRRMLAIGLPAGAEFALMFVVVAVVYSIIRDFGAAAQAGFGIGARVMQSIFLPAMAVAFATAPIAGQNFGARRPDRVRATFRHAALTSSLIMLSLTLLCQLAPEALIGAFAQDEEVVEFGATYLRILSWNFVASGIIFTCAGMFQGLGNTAPALLSSVGRLLSFVLPALWLSRQEGFRIEQVWYVSVASVALQALCSVALLLQQMRRRLSGFDVPATPRAPG